MGPLEIWVNDAGRAVTTDWIEPAKKAVAPFHPYQTVCELEDVRELVKKNPVFPVCYSKDLGFQAFVHE